MALTSTTVRFDHHRDGLDRALLGLVDAGLAAVILVAPFFMGGRQSLGQLVLVALAWLVATAWLLRQAARREGRWLHSPVQWVLLAALMLVSWQLAPLSPALLNLLSPAQSELLPLWTAGSLGAWRQVSLSPEETRDGLVLLTAYALLALVVTQRVARLKDVERLLRLLALAAVLMAAFGLLQYLASNGEFFWFYRHPYVDTTTSVRGAFTNRNHFAHFLGLGLGPLLWWLQKGMRARPARRGREWSARLAAGHGEDRQAWRVGLGWLLLAITLFALLMSFSRGGMLAATLACAVYVAIAFRGGLLSQRFAWSLAGVALLVATSLVIHGYHSVAERVGDLASGSLEELDQQQGRRKIWGAALDAVVDFPLLGAGVGTHRALYPRYLEHYSPTDYTHAENGYLQLAEETGLAGVLLLTAVGGLCLNWCLRVLRGSADRRRLACLAAITATLVMSAVHSCADFVWYVPSCVVVVAVLAPCAYHLARRTAGSSSTASEFALPRTVWFSGAAVTAVLGAICVLRQVGPAWAEPHWDHYRLTHRGLNDARQIAELMLRDFTAIAVRDPDDARGHLGAAEAHLRRFDLLQQASDNRMSLTALRDAAGAWPDASRGQLHDWLSRATGAGKPHLDRALWHTRRALALCPLHGQGYLYLAELAFLEPDSGLTPETCIHQALRVRPYDGGVLFKAGEEAALRGDIAAALVHWKRAFHAGPVVQGQVIDYAAARGFPVSLFTEHFEPDVPAFRQLYTRYRPVTPTEVFHDFLRAYAAAAEQEARASRGSAAATAWLEVHHLAAELMEPSRAEQAARRAIQCDAAHFPAHLALGKHLLAEEKFEQAETELRWCQMRRAADASLTQLVEQATKGRIHQQTRAAPVSGSPRTTSAAHYDRK